MVYQTQDTQPERTALAWSRTSLSLMVGTLWVCRAAFLSGSVLAWLIIAFGAAVMIVHYFLLRARKRKLRTGVDNSTGSGVENFLVVIQLALVGVAALVLEQ